MHALWWISIYFHLIILFLMSHICTGCNLGYPSSKGLERHELHCSLKIAQQVVPDDAYDIFKRKQERKRQKTRELQRRQNTSNNPPLSELPHVCQFPSH